MLPISKIVTNIFSKIKSIVKSKSVFLFVFIILAALFGRTVLAVWSGTFYNPGDTLNPECLPTQTDCDVLPPLTSLSGAVLLSQTSPQTIGATGARLAKLWATDVATTDLTVTNTISGNISGNAGTVTNGVYTSGSYSNPSWLTAVPYSILSGTIPTWNQDTTGTSAKTNALNSATTVVNVSSATAPTNGQVLTATSSTAATWQTLTGLPSGTTDQTMRYDGANWVGTSDLKVDSTGAIALTGTSFGSSIMTNGDFATGTCTGWTTTGWTCNAGVSVTHNTGNTSNLTRNITGLKAQLYRLTYTISGQTGGNIRFGFSGATGGGPNRTADGTYIEDYYTTATALTIFGIPDTNFNGTIDNVTFQPEAGNVVRPTNPFYFQSTSNRTGFNPAFVFEYSTTGAWSTSSGGLVINPLSANAYGNPITVYGPGTATSIFSVDGEGSIISAKSITAATSDFIPQTFGKGLLNSVAGNTTTAGVLLPIGASATRTNTSGAQSIVGISTTYNQSGSTAANTDLLINRTETALGSGAQYLIDAGTGGGSYVSKFNVSNTGAITGKTSLTLGSVAGTTGSILLNGLTSGTVTLKPADTAGTWSMTLPTTAGSASQYLQTDGNGATTWATVAGLPAGTTDQTMRYDGANWVGTSDLKVGSTGVVTLDGTSYGPNLLTNGDFATGTCTGWTTTGWTCNAGVSATHNSGSSNYLSHTSVTGLVRGALYRIDYTISGLTTGTISVRVASQSENPHPTGNGIKTRYVYSSATSMTLDIVPSTLSDGTVDDITMRLVNCALCKTEGPMVFDTSLSWPLAEPAFTFRWDSPSADMSGGHYGNGFELHPGSNIYGNLFTIFGTGVETSVFSVTRLGAATAAAAVTGTIINATTGDFVPQTWGKGILNSVAGTTTTAGVLLPIGTSVTRTNTSGAQSIVGISTTYNQATGTAANTDLLINRTETALGSGAQYLIDAQVGGVSQFAVSNTGGLTLGSGLGPELITNGNFATGTCDGWTTTGWTCNAGVSVSHSSGTSNLVPNPVISTTAGSFYRIQLTTTNWTTGTIWVYAGTNYLGIGPANQTHTIYIQSLGSGGFKIEPSSNTDGTFDNISVKKVVGIASSTAGPLVFSANPTTSVSNNPYAVFFDLDASSDAGRGIGIATRGAHATYDLQITQDGLDIFNVYYNGVTTAYGDFVSTAGLFKPVTFGKGLLNSSVGTLTTAGVVLPIGTSVTRTNTSGAQQIVGISTTYNQATGTAANTDLLINRTVTAVGSGAQVLADYQVGGTSWYKFATGNTATTGGFNASSGTEYGVSLTPIINQSGTAGWTGLYVNPTLTAVGSGVQTSAVFMGGNVGIGNTAPSETLHVTGGFRATGATTGGRGLGIFGDDTNGMHIVSITDSSNRSTSTNGISASKWAINGTGQFWYTSGNTAAPNVRTWTQRMEILLTNGYVGMGPNTPLSPLHVQSSPSASANIGTLSIGGGANAYWDGSSSGHFVGSASGTSLAINEVSGYAGNLIDAQVAGVSNFSVTSAGVIQQKGCVIAGTLSADTSGNIICTSDERLKNILGDYEGGLDALSQINPQLFTYKTSPSNPVETFVHAGFVAQNVMAVIPQASALQPNGYYSLDTTAVLATAVNAIQEMNLNIDGVAGANVPVPGSTTETFVATFFANVYAKIGTWLADATNGVAKIFTGEIDTKNLCVSDDTGAKTCLTKMQLDALILGAGGSSTSTPAPEPVPEPIPEPVPDPVPEPTPEPAVEPVPEPAPEPVPEPIPEPVPDPVPPTP